MICTRLGRTLHTGMECKTVNKNDSRIFGIFNRTGAVSVVEDDITFNRQSGRCGSGKGWLNASPLGVTGFLINDRSLRLCPSMTVEGKELVKESTKDHRVDGAKGTIPYTIP